MAEIQPFSEEAMGKMDSFQATISDLASRVQTLLNRQNTDPTTPEKRNGNPTAPQNTDEENNSQKRILIGLAGVPGSGKSTVSAALLIELAKRGVDVGGQSGEVVVVPMDGFHYTKATLSSMEDPATAFRRRGAAFTFDAEGFVELVLKLKEFPVTSSSSTTSSLDPAHRPTQEANDIKPVEPKNNETFMYAPSFDHAVQDPVPNAIAISSRSRVVIVEGNYTLLDIEPWSRLRGVWDQKWFVDADPEVVKDRLVKRHLAAGIETEVEKAVVRVEGNDLVNGEVVRRALGEVDVVIVN